MDEDSYIKLCRLCLRKPEGEPSWLTNQNIKDELREALSDVELKETDRLSQIICQSCINLIQTIRDFKQTIVKNQSFLLSILQKPEFGHFVEVNVIEPVIKREEPVNEPSNTSPKVTKHSYDEELVSDQDDSNYEPSEKDSSSDEDLAIPDKDSKINSTILARTRSGSKPVAAVVKQKAKEKPLTCVRCNLHFRTTKTLARHNRNTHIVEDYPFACSLCISARFVSEDLLNLHKKRHEPDEAKREQQPFACSACELRFCKQSLLDNHTKHHERNELDSCQICGATLHRWSMPDHLATHSKNKEDYEHVCSLCGKRYAAEHSLVKHQKKHTAVKKPLFECDKCGKKIMKKGSLVHHVQRCGAYSCRICEQTFPNRSHRDIHEKKLHKGWKCKQCDMHFDRQYDFYKHQETLEHKMKGKRFDLAKYKDKKYVCPVCGKEFPLEWRLLKHEKRHVTPKGFDCNKCGKRIITKGAFESHIKRCEGDFPCRYCKERFPTYKHMYNHEERAHKGFNCRRCDMHFDRRQGLKMHQLTLEHKKKGKWGKLIADDDLENEGISK